MNKEMTEKILEVLNSIDDRLGIIEEQISIGWDDTTLFLIRELKELMKRGHEAR